MEFEDLLKRLDRIDDMPTLPEIFMKVNQMIEDQNTSINELSRTIEKDQSMASKILRLVNSAFFGLRSRVSHIPHAVTLVGFHAVRNAALSVSLVDAFLGKEVLEELDMTAFWTHSVAVAVTGKSLGEKTLLYPPDQCFTAGILHDIGKMVLACYFQDLFKKIWAFSKENSLSFYEAEGKNMNGDHARIGAYLARRWQFPMDLVEAIRSHHSERFKENDPCPAVIIHIADIIVNGHGDHSAKDLDLSILPPKLSGILAPLLESLSEWFPEVSREIDSACQFFIKDGKQ